jgi:5-formyltetrahydrofolate cyclo-ligase
MKLESSTKAQKIALRKKLRERRRNLEINDRKAMDQAIRQFLVTYIAQSGPMVVAAFWPFDGEPDLSPVFELLESDGVTLALPVIRHSSETTSMSFRRWSKATPMKNNRYGIPEPVAAPKISLSEIELLLMPLVGWDEDCGRLGMGRGYYDRALRPFRQSPNPVRVGVAYGLQKVSHVPAEPWDIPLHRVLSESGWHIAPGTSEARASKKTA